MVIRAYFQPLRNMALKITCPTDRERLFGNPKYSWELQMLSTLGRLMAIISTLSSGRYPLCTALSRPGKREMLRNTLIGFLCAFAHVSLKLL